MWLQNATFNRHTTETVIAYVRALFPDPFAPFMEFAMGSYAPLGLTTLALVLIIALIPPGIIAAVAIARNPHRDTPMLHGDARFATKKDVIAMGAAKQVGPGGQYLHYGYAFGMRMALIETLSSTVVAPPGTGKTARIIVPGIASSDTSCLVIHDPKPELWDICSGHRAKLGSCFRLDWSQVDDPEKGIWHPCFNFLDPNLMPPRESPERDTLIEALTKTLIPDKKGGGRHLLRGQGPRRPDRLHALPRGHHQRRKAVRRLA